ncbi:hypothetical protein ARTHRO9AX_10338 [Arthrobacter sp. 9AX]|nr:hypothetical protein ARTHRO9AX_10338 [Arthrobacter sp. 9AX]
MPFHLSVPFPQFLNNGINDGHNRRGFFFPNPHPHYPNSARSKKIGVHSATLFPPCPSCQFR